MDDGEFHHVVSTIVTIISEACYHTAAPWQVWMSEMKEYISSIPLHALMLPGSHNAGSWDQFESYTDDTVLMRYSVNQGEDIWTQLLLGIRWLSLVPFFIYQFRETAFQISRPAG